MDNSNLEEFINRETDKSSKMVKLLENELFQELILKGFLEESIKEIVVDYDLYADATRDALTARQIFHRYIYDIITNGEKLKP